MTDKADDPTADDLIEVAQAFEDAGVPKGMVIESLCVSTADLSTPEHPDRTRCTIVIEAHNKKPS